MQLSGFDLCQIDVESLRSLSPEQLRVVAQKLPLDAEGGRELANQTPQNSSRPPSSRAPGTTAKWKSRGGVQRSAEG